MKNIKGEYCMVLGRYEIFLIIIIEYVHKLQKHLAHLAHNKQLYESQQH